MSRSSKLSAIWTKVGKLEVVAMDKTVTGDGARKRSSDRDAFSDM